MIKIILITVSLLVVLSTIENVFSFRHFSISSSIYKKFQMPSQSQLKAGKQDLFSGIISSDC